VATADLRGLSHRYPAAGSTALSDVSVSLDPGLTLVAGASGSGKSTLLRVFNGLVPHFHGGRITGSATVAGLDVFTTPTRRLARHVGFVAQDPESQFVGGTVEREVAFGPENLGVAAREIARRVDRALARTSTKQLRHRSVASLSGGERQRVAIASALAMCPEVLVLDEPGSQLDAAGSHDVAVLAREVADDGAVVVLAEHRLDELFTFSDRLLVLDGGKISADGRPAATASALADPPGLVRLAVAASWSPPPLTADEARRRLPGLKGLAASGAAVGFPESWTVANLTVVLGHKAILDNATLSGGGGEVVVLVGANGSGKTTLLRALAGVIAPTTGRVARPPGAIAYLPQNPGAVLCLPSVREEVMLTLRLRGQDPDRARRPPDGRRRDPDRDPLAILERLGLAGLAGAHPSDLSSGERQRAALATLLCGSPTMALLDEPTRGMDPRARTALAGEVKRLAGRGAAVVIATHDTELAALVADRVVQVSGGGLVELGDPRRALTGTGPYATPLGRLRFEGPLTVDEALAAR